MINSETEERYQKYIAAIVSKTSMEEIMEHIRHHVCDEKQDLLDAPYTWSASMYNLLAIFDGVVCKQTPGIATRLWRLREYALKYPNSIQDPTP